MPTWHPRQQPV